VRPAFASFIAVTGQLPAYLLLLTASLLSPAADVPFAAAGVPAVAILFACGIIPVSVLAIFKIHLKSFCQCFGSVFI
jgi:hypothetical protein